jgi:hypothetical protein
MRAITWISAVVVLALSGSALGDQPSCPGCYGGPAGPGIPAVQRGLDAEPCCGPIGYCLGPGCCEYRRHCCDNAWAGYCEEKARSEAFWANFCNPCGGSCRRSCRQAPMAVYDSACPTSTVAPQPTPAVQPAPAVPAHPPAPTPTPPAASPKLGQNADGARP